MNLPSAFASIDKDFVRAGDVATYDFSITSSDGQKVSGTDIETVGEENNQIIVSRSLADQNGKPIVQVGNYQINLPNKVEYKDMFQAENLYLLHGSDCIGTTYKALNGDVYVVCELSQEDAQGNTQNLKMAYPYGVFHHSKRLPVGLVVFSDTKYATGEEIHQELRDFRRN
jgi:hypothetical protein